MANVKVTETETSKALGLNMDQFMEKVNTAALEIIKGENFADQCAAAIKENPDKTYNLKGGIQNASNITGNDVADAFINPTLKKDLEEMFDQFDADGNEKLDPEEEKGLVNAFLFANHKKWLAFLTNLFKTTLQGGMCTLSRVLLIFL